MASHRSTPRSVLDAPTRTVSWLVEHKGATRFERRHYRPTKTGPLRQHSRDIRRQAGIGLAAAGLNRPYRKPAAGWSKLGETTDGAEVLVAAPGTPIPAGR